MDCFEITSLNTDDNTAKVELKGKSQDQIYEVIANSFLSDQYYNLVVISAICIVNEYVNTIVPAVLVNISSESIFVDNNKILGFWQRSCEN